MQLRTDQRILFGQKSFQKQSLKGFTDTVMYIPTSIVMGGGEDSIETSRCAYIGLKNYVLKTRFADKAPDSVVIFLEKIKISRLDVWK